jgi:hypothetical protein
MSLILESDIPFCANPEISTPAMAKELPQNNAFLRPTLSSKIAVKGPAIKFPALTIATFRPIQVDVSWKSAFGTTLLAKLNPLFKHAALTNKEALAQQQVIDHAGIIRHVSHGEHSRQHTCCRRNFVIDVDKHGVESAYDT